MKQLLIIGLMLSISCAKPKSYSNEQFNNEKLSNQTGMDTMDFDSLTLKAIIMDNNKILGIPIIRLEDKQKAEAINNKLQSKSYKISIYNSYDFKIQANKKCNNYNHLIISKKELNRDGYYQESYKSLYLLIIDSSNKVVDTEKLEEKSNTFSNRSTNWSIDQDSTLTIKYKSHWCSDLEIEGIGSECWDEEIQKIYKLKCSGLKLIKNDSTRTSSIE
jgi:hypothetical protein